MTLANTSSTKSRRRARIMAVLGLAGGLYVAPALTEMSSAHASGAINAATDPLTAKECGSCHMAFGPGYLPAGSWRQMMDNLSNHFGEDASLADGQRQQITAYLESHAGGAGNAGLRITEQKWFTREHGFRLSSLFSRKASKLSDCAACHAVAGQRKR